jgi:hypothetical protein
VSTVSSSSRFVVEGVFRESGVVHSFKVVDPGLFVFESHVLYAFSRFVFFKSHSQDNEIMAVIRYQWIVEPTELLVL